MLSPRQSRCRKQLRDMYHLTDDRVKSLCINLTGIHNDYDIALDIVQDRITKLEFIQEWIKDKYPREFSKYFKSNEEASKFKARVLNLYTDKKVINVRTYLKCKEIMEDIK